MADVAIYVADIGVGNNTLNISGFCRVAPNSDEVTWQCYVPWTYSAATINGAIKSAAVAACEAAGYTIDPQDAKTLFGGASNP